MPEFKTSKINQGFDDIASFLKEARVSQGLSIEKVSEELGIKKIYLEAIEAGDFSSLPTGLYGKSYVKEYAIYLKVNPKPLLELYDEGLVVDKEDKKKLFVRKVPSFHYFLSIPRITKTFIVVAIVAVCLMYLSYYIKNITEPPKLELYNIEDNMVSESSFINIEGKTENESEVFINDENILLDNNSEFFKKVNLKKGINTIIVMAKKKYSRKNERIIKVLVK